MKTIIYYDEEPDNWGDCFTPAYLAWYFANKEKILWVFNWYLRTSVHKYKNLTTYDIFSELKGYPMPRKKGNSDVQRDSGKRDNSGMRGNNISWLNIKLNDTDNAELTGSKAEFEFLAASILGICSDGISLSIKTVDDGESFCCTLIGSDIGADSRTFGMSSFAGELRDVLLVSLYKFDTYLEGDFANGDKFVNDTKQRSRFR